MRGLGILRHPVAPHLDTLVLDDAPVEWIRAGLPDTTQRPIHRLVVGIERDLAGPPRLLQDRDLLLAGPRRPGARQLVVEQGGELRIGRIGRLIRRTPGAGGHRHHGDHQRTTPNSRRARPGAVNHVPDTTSSRGSGGVAMPGAAAHPATTPKLHTHLVPTTDVDPVLQIGLIALPYDQCDSLVRYYINSMLPQATQEWTTLLIVI